MSLSRKYRPKSFSEITGQNTVKETLRREVETGKLGYAYLFSGPRGIGKTTMARVFAKALNCLKPDNGEPCNECDACNEQNASRSMDVIEMDAASNTGVDNIREAIIEHVRFVPHSRKHKVYILDEAHMLSTSAWNALLKTLEEPPPYAIFILVTTELHRVPATIQSRCQRFDFRRITDVDVSLRLNRIADEEGVKVDDTVVRSIISKSDGGMRDAESLLGQLLVLGEKHITDEIAGLVLPASRLNVTSQLLKTWSTRQLGPSLNAIQVLEDQGMPLLPLFDDLLHSVRDLLIAHDSEEWKKKLAKGDVGEKELSSLVSVFSPAELTDMALMLMERRRDAKQGADVRFCLELAAAAVALGVLPHGPGGTKPEVTTPMQPIYVPVAEPALTPVKEKDEKAAPGHEASDVTLGKIRSKWPALVRAIDQKSHSLTFIFKLSQPMSLDGNVLTIRFRYQFHMDKIVGEVKSKNLVEDCLRSTVGSSDLCIDGIVADAVAEEEPAKKQDMVSSVMKAFEGQIVETKGSEA